MVSCAIIGVLIERIAYKRLRNATRIAAFITAIGVSLFIEYGVIYMRGAQPKRIQMYYAIVHLIFLVLKLAVNLFLILSVSVVLNDYSYNLLYIKRKSEKRCEPFLMMLKQLTDGNQC